MDERQGIEQGRERRRRQRARPGAADYFHFYWRDWLTDGVVRALSRDERAGFADVLCMTWSTRTPGTYSEESCREWAGYSEAEWPQHRARFMALHKVKRDGRWIEPRTRTEALATDRRMKMAARRSKKAAQEMWRKKSEQAGRAPRVLPTGEGQLDPDQLAGEVLGRLAGKAGR